MKRQLITLILIGLSIGVFSQDKTISGDIIYDYGRLSTLWSTVDQVGPVLDSAVTLTETTIRLYYDENLFGSPDTSAFHVTPNTENYNVTDVAVSGSYITLTLSRDILAGQFITVNYSKPETNTLTDQFGNVSLTVENFEVTNNVEDDPSVATPLADYRLSQNVEDYLENYDATASTGLYYETGAGSHAYCVVVDGSALYFDTPSIPMTSSFSVSFGWLSSGFEHTDRVLIDGGEWKVKLDAVDGNFKLLTDAGGTPDSAYTADDVYASGKWQSVVVTVDMTNGLTDGCHIFVNGVDQTEDSITLNSFTTTSTIRFGQDKTGINQSWGRMINPKLYSGILTDSEIADLHQASGFGTTDPDITAPTVDTIIANTNQFILYASEELFDAYVDTVSFELTEDGTRVEFAGDPVMTGNSITFSTEAMTSGTLSLSYDKTGSNDLKDLAGNEMATFTTTPRNDTPSNPIYPLNWYKLNNDATDALGNNNGAINGLTFSTTPKIEGAYSGNADGSSKTFYNSGQSFGGQWSIHIPCYFPSSGTKEILQTQETPGGTLDIDGMRLYFNNTTGQFGFVTHDGVNEVIATSTTGHQATADWIILDLAVDEDADTVAFYINGEFATLSKTIDNDFPTNEQIIFGGGRVGWMYGYFDAITLYDGLFDQSNATALNIAPDDTISSRGVSPVDPNPNPNPDLYDIVFTQDLEGHTSVPIEYTNAIWNPDWNNPGWRDGDNRWPTWFAQNIFDSIVEDPTSTTSSKTLKFNFTDTIVDGWSGVSPYRGGDYWKTTLDTDPKELYLTYNVMFRPGFVFNEGGKLPAVNGGGPLDKTTQEDCTQPAYGEGFSGALMWRPYGGVAFYTFFQNQAIEQWGQTDRWNDYQPTGDGLNYDDENRFIFDVTDSTWYNITIRIVCNTTYADGTPELQNGIFEGFINGHLIERIEDMFLVTNPDHLWGVFQIATGVFFGGNETYQAPQRKEWILLDDVVTFTYKSGVTGISYGNNVTDPSTVLTLPNWPKTDDLDD